MNAPHLHLVLNHFPIVIPFIGLVVLTAGYFSASSTIRKTAYGIFLLGAISAIPGFFTGEGAEEVVEKLPGVAKTAIEEHEDAAKLFVAFAYALGALALGGFVAEWKWKRMVVPAALVVTLAAIGTLIIAQQAGTTGGKIRHPEISNTTAANLPANANEPDDD
jgi:uncharacterized membrane protein